MVEDSLPKVDIPTTHVLEQALVTSRRQEAINTVKSCLGHDGVIASGGLSRYSHEYWTRDMCYSHEAVESLGFEKYIGQHINRLIEFSREGQIPTLFFGYPRRLSPSAKFTDEIDSELLTLDLMRQMKRLEGFDEVWKYVESRTDSAGFVYGRDWRDGMRIYKDKATFYNQVLLYKICPERTKRKIRDGINDVFWLPSRGYYADYLDKKGKKSRRLDVLGHALAILYNIIPESRIGLVNHSLKRALTKYGYVNVKPRYPRSSCGWWRLIPNNFYQNGGIWGLVQGHMILALLHLDSINEATDQFWKMTRWKGFNEWYDPVTGKPKGSRNQLWTAALWLRCYDALSGRVGLKSSANPSTHNPIN